MGTLERGILWRDFDVFLGLEARYSNWCGDGGHGSGLSGFRKKLATIVAALATFSHRFPGKINPGGREWRDRGFEYLFSGGDLG